MKFEYRGKTFDIDALSQNDHILNSIINNKTFYEIDLLEYITSTRKHFCAEDSIAIDIGANIGNHSIFFQTFLVSHVIAVEPNPAVFSLLERNLQTNIKNYTLYKNALGESRGRGALVLPVDCERKIGMAKIDAGAVGGDIDILTVDAILEEWLAGREGPQNVSMIKIDVEGMELDVLKGARKTLMKYRPQLFLEAATGRDFEKLNEFLRELGYESLGCWAVTPVYHFCYKPSFAFKNAVRREKVKERVKFFKNKYFGAWAR